MTAMAVPSSDLPIFIDIMTSSMVQHGGIGSEAREMEALRRRRWAVMALLMLDDLHLSFGGVTALSGVSLGVNVGDFFAIIGPNGAGKTSIFNCISGIYAPIRGRIFFDGHDISHLRPDQRAKLGIAR